MVNSCNMATSSLALQSIASVVITLDDADDNGVMEICDIACIGNMELWLVYYNYV